MKPISGTWNLPATYNKAANRIKDYYFERIDELNPSKLGHFLQRIQVCYGPHWEKELHRAFIPVVDETWELWNEYKDGNFSSAEEKKRNGLREVEGGGSEVKNLFPGVKAASSKWAIDHLPEFAWEQGFGEVQNNYSIIKRMGMLKDLRQSLDIKRWLSDGWAVRWKWLLDNPTVVVSHPVHTVNYLYYGLESGFVKGKEFEKCESQLIQMIHTQYKGKLNDDMIFNNYIYAWTHMIIGGSGYYVKFLPEYNQRYGAIVDILTKNKDRIFSTSNDITAEVGLCFVICRIPHQVNIYRDEMLKRIDSKSGIVESDGADGDINLLEHTNILTIMLLNGLKYMRGYLNEDVVKESTFPLLSFTEFLNKS